MVRRIYIVKYKDNGLNDFGTLLFRPSTGKWYIRDHEEETREFVWLPVNVSLYS